MLEGVTLMWIRLQRTSIQGEDPSLETGEESQRIRDESRHSQTGAEEDAG